MKGYRRKSGSAALMSALAVCAPLVGCVSADGAPSYPASSVHTPIRLEAGVIERVRSVVIEGEKTIVGPAAGAVIGGVAGSQVGGGSEERTIMAIAGAVLGGMAGSAIEKGVTRKTGAAYTVRLNRGGELVTVVQEGAAVFAPGDRVHVEYGAVTRVVP
ncbi:MAG: glycine zipper 2TM domain-containing protein [Alphaproteobacteria bacterium]|nr:glycine zipper 2TM domain-containing protein [Alphaproteobacteria bacterium]